MNLYTTFRDRVCQEIAALAEAGELPADLPTENVKVEPPRDPAHGDIATNAALVLAKPAGMKPRDIGELLAARLGALAEVAEAGVAGPGFVNMRLAHGFWHDMLARVLRAGAGWGTSDMGWGRTVNVEYVSANPTGPLTVGHARGAVVGDATASLLEAAGYTVTREYYINDGGAQVDTLARSAYLRYREALGEAIAEIPAGLYPGQYLCAVGEALAERDGDKWLNAPESEWLPVVRQFAIDHLMAWIREDLAALGVRQDRFTSERALVENGAVDAVLETLDQRGLIYEGTLPAPKGKTPEDWEPTPQTLFRASDYGDDQDRPLKKSDGSWTYFAVDIAYHLDKYRRGHGTLVDVLGEDHGGHVTRMKAAVRAVTNDEARFHILLCRVVKLLRGGEPVKMSKRAGTFVTLREILDEVGKDVIRFTMLTRKNDAALDFDLEKVVEQSKDNPVFYVQYAHARCHSVLGHAERELADVALDGASLAEVELHRLRQPEEIELIRFLAGWPRLIEGAAETYEPHRVAFYLHDLAAAFHGFWTKGKDDATLRFLQPDDMELTRARLALVRGVQQVIASGLEIMGVTPVTELR
ncbi:arginyl-tRNA synthetase [Limimonas halophila]|uniref:Arginine--tRNA ligase n=1 Tax=Limimonas halophila TaxID=1082479 RepID=A0A1G7NGF6_9PROT|nr:arginine--tRNA ligase [Limimonas halophila]SDF73007.1 arginyl-tRNA synthetase [Limimonas halophila]